MFNIYFLTFCSLILPSKATVRVWCRCYQPSWTTEKTAFMKMFHRSSWCTAATVQHSAAATMMTTTMLNHCVCVVWRSVLVASVKDIFLMSVMPRATNTHVKWVSHSSQFIDYYLQRCKQDFFHDQVQDFIQCKNI